MVQREYKFANKGHTEGNLLTEHLSRMEGVTYAGYSVDDDGEYLQLCIDAADPNAALREATERVCAELTQLHEQLSAHLY